MNIMHKCACALSVVLLAQASPIDAAAAIVVNVDQWAVVRNGVTILDDSFDRNMPLNGGSGASVSSGTIFSDGTPANYFVQGLLPLTTANNGQAQFNSANGILTGQPPVHQMNASIQTGTSPAGQHTLTSATSFSGIILFDLAVPSVVSQQYQFYLTNNTATPGLEVRMPIVQTSAGLVLRYVWLDFRTNPNPRTVINEVPLTQADLAEPQLKLEFDKPANSDVITAS